MKPKGTNFTHDRKVAYCKELAKSGEHARAREKVGVCGKTVDKHRLKFPEFDKLVEEAMESYRASLAAEIHRRGVDGWEEPVFQGGIEVGKKQRFSDALLLAQAKRHMPDEYGDRLRVEQTKRLELAISVEQLQPESRRLMRKIIEIEMAAQAKPAITVEEG